MTLKQSNHITKKKSENRRLPKKKKEGMDERQILLDLG